MQVFNYDSDFDLELFEKKKTDKVILGKEDWRLEQYKSGRKEYWRFAKLSRKNKRIVYIGKIEKVRELYSDRFNNRKSRNNNIRNTQIVESFK